MYLLDTNIVVYLLKQDEGVIRFLDPLKGQGSFAISTVTRFEALIGRKNHHMSLAEAEDYLDDFLNIEFDNNIVRNAVLFFENNKKVLRFKDLVIAATAKSHNRTLISADKDFMKFEGLKTLIYKP